MKGNEDGGGEKGKDPEGWGGEAGGRGDQDGEHMGKERFKKEMQKEGKKLNIVGLYRL